MIILGVCISHVFIHDCACDDTSEGSLCICWGWRVWKQVRIWAGGCLAYTTPIASDDISFIPQAQSCFLLNDKSSSFSLKPFCHTTHLEGLHVKMISMVFSHTHKVTVE